jgi:CRISPR-associated protein Cmr6
MTNDPNMAANSALILSTQLKTTGDKGEGQKELYGVAINALGHAHDVYEKAYGRWCGITSGARFETIDFRVSGRMVIGLGTTSVLENGLTLHHTYGTPVIPGSALKGMTAHYCDNNLGISNPDFSQSNKILREDGKKESKPGRYYQMLFGTNDNAGIISFHDAWITPAWVVNGKSLLPDVITTHHQKYYSDSPIQPTDTEDPIPIQFLSVQGVFRIVLEVEDNSIDAIKWRQFMMVMVKKALADLGIGGKTSSGYGRMKP